MSLSIIYNIFIILFVVLHIIAINTTINIIPQEYIIKICKILIMLLYNYITYKLLLFLNIII